MENKKKRNKAIIISIIVLIVLSLALFLIYKNKDSFGVKTSSVLTRIFSPLETSDNKKKEMVIADGYIYAGDNVSETGLDGNTRKVKKTTDSDNYILGRAINDINPGEIGEIELLDTGGNSFWNSFSSFLSNTFKFTPACSDGKDNDDDSLIDEKDPNCHEGGDINEEYVPKHFSESASPFSSKFVCSDGKDNDEDGLTDEKDPNCHKGGDLNGEYVPRHFSESESPFDPDLGIDGIDLRADMVSPTSSQINTEVELSSVITNHGNENSQQEINVLFTISDVRDGESSNNIYLATTIPEILAESQGTVSVKQLFTNTGVYYIRACADKKDNSDVGLITEAFEENNCGGWTTFTVTNVLPDDGTRPECSDEKDNDGDSLIDINDPVCHENGDINDEYLPEYDSESQVSYECNDTLDNDDDGLIDEKDPVCHENGDINDEYLPEYDSESQVSYECNDTIDNDDDSYIDSLDPNCHIDGLLTNEYKPTHDSESESPTEDVCLAIEQNPITFTEEEKAKLADLTKKFFLISPSLQSEDSISSVYLDILDQDNFIGQLDTLTKECYAETIDKNGNLGGRYDVNGKWISYTGPKIKYGNPWYDYDNRGSYLDERAIADYLKEDPYAYSGIEAIKGCTEETSGTKDCQPQISNTFGYCVIGKEDPHGKNFDCSKFKTFESCRMYGRGYMTGCEWVYTFPIKEYEALLNVW